MNLALFGATGFIGSAVLEEALARGCRVTALVREPGRLQGRGNPVLVEGDVLDRAAVARTVAGAGAVVSALGPRRGEKPDPEFLASALSLILSVMAVSRVRRLIAISGAGLTHAGERKPLQHRIASRVVSVLARDAYEGKRRELAVLAASDIDWTAVRPTRVVDGPASSEVRVSTDSRNIGLRVTRGSLARVIVDLALSDTYLQAAPYISN